MITLYSVIAMIPILIHFSCIECCKQLETSKKIILKIKADKIMLDIIYNFHLETIKHNIRTKTIVMQLTNIYAMYNKRK